MTLHDLIQTAVGQRVPLELAGWLVGGLSLGLAVLILGWSMSLHRERWSRMGPTGGVLLRPDTDKGYAALIVALTLVPFWWWAGPEVWRALESPGLLWGPLFIGGVGLSALAAVGVWLIADFFLRQLLLPQPVVEIDRLPLAPGDRAAIHVYLPHPYRPIRRLRLTLECFERTFADQRTAGELVGVVLLVLSFRYWWPQISGYGTGCRSSCDPWCVASEYEWQDRDLPPRGPLWGDSRVSHQAVVEDTAAVERHAGWNAPLWSGHMRIPSSGPRSQRESSLDPEASPRQVAWTLAATVAIGLGLPCQASFTISVR